MRSRCVASQLPGDRLTLPTRDRLTFGLEALSLDDEADVAAAGAVTWSDLAAAVLEPTSSGGKSCTTYLMRLIWHP